MPVESPNAEAISFYRCSIPNEYCNATSNISVLPWTVAFRTYEYACRKAFANVGNISEGKEIASLMMLPSQKFQLSAKQAGESIKGQAR